MLTRVTDIGAGSFDRLHPSKIADQEQILDLLARVKKDRIALQRGMNRRILPEIARISRIEPTSLLLSIENFELDRRAQIFLNFTIDGQPYFFAAPVVDRIGQRILRTGIPKVVYRAERRDHDRRPPGEDVAARVALRWGGHTQSEGIVADASAEGLAVVLPSDRAPSIGHGLAIQILEGPHRGESFNGEVRNQAELTGRKGWSRIGLGVTRAPARSALREEKRDRILESTRSERLQRQWRVLRAGARAASDRVFGQVGRRPKLPRVDFARYRNELGEELSAIINRWGDTRGAPAVVIPPAWGKTKETLMPLAVCMAESFEAARQPIVVIRFDGIRKRGESFNDPACRSPGKDHHRFTFSQGVKDIRATIDFLERSQEFTPRSVILVSFSASSIEARRAVAADKRISGWVSVVGSADLQSMMRVISGGVDYAGGLARGVRFGLQQILGVEVDMDHAGIDAFENKLVYLEDARRDMSQIQVPVTWIHGRYDAWMDPDRVRDALSRGDTSKRQFIEVPTGHTLKDSREALETFQLITREVSRMALGREVPAVIPDLRELELRRRAERQRLPDQCGDVRAFWQDYLVGPDGGLGIEMMNSISPYEELMAAQIEALELRAGWRILDLGSGTGALPLHLLRGDWPSVEVYELDFVREGLVRARDRCHELDGESSRRVHCVECNLDPRRRPHVPIATGTMDAVLGSLFLSYVEHPGPALLEAHRVLKPGGRLVVSSLCRDPDMSKLYMDGIAELRKGRARELLGDGAETRIDEAAQAYLNQAARLLDLEEQGRFRFYDPTELEKLVRRAGFRRVRSARSLGDPPQAAIVTAERP